MTARDVLTDELRRRFPRAEVTVTPGKTGYVVTVTAEDFRGVHPADARAMVYQTLGRVPLELLAKVAEIAAVVPTLPPVKKKVEV